MGSPQFRPVKGGSSVKKEKKSRPELSDAHFEATETVCSANDCTGLIPSATPDRTVSSYEEMYHYLPPQEIRNGKSHRHSDS